MATPTNGNGNLVDEFEEAFQQCLSILTKDEGLGNNGIGISSGVTVDKDEARTEVEQVTLRFIDLARQMEAFFLQKRFLLSVLKPELVVKEDVSDLKMELTRKEDLIKRHYDKIAVWQSLLADLQGWAKSPAQGPPAPNGLPTGAQSGQNQQAGNGSSNTTMQQQQQQILQHQQQLQQQQQLQHLQQHQMQQQQLHQQQYAFSKLERKERHAKSEEGCHRVSEDFVLVFTRRNAKMLILFGLLFYFGKFYSESIKMYNLTA